MSSYSFRFLLPAAFLVLALSVPAATHANTALVTGASAQQALISRVSPSIAIAQKETGRDIVFTYANLPKDSVIVMTKAKTRNQVGVWNYGVSEGGSGTVDTLFPNFPHGTYALRAVSASDGSRITESASFSVTKKAVDTSYSSRQLATYRQWINGESTYTEKLGMTKKRALAACKKATRAEDAQVSCAWNGKSIGE